MIVDEPSVGTAYGSVVVAPYISKFLELVLPYLGIEPNYDIDSENYEQISVPNIEGLPIDQAKDALNKKLQDTLNEALTPFIYEGNAVDTITVSANDYDAMQVYMASLGFTSNLETKVNKIFVKA
jgi:hypothetical protein